MPVSFLVYSFSMNVVSCLHKLGNALVTTSQEGQESRQWGGQLRQRARSGKEVTEQDAFLGRWSLQWRQYLKLACSLSGLWANWRHSTCSMTYSSRQSHRALAGEFEALGILSGAKLQSLSSDVCFQSVEKSSNHWCGSVSQHAFRVTQLLAICNTGARKV